MGYTELIEYIKGRLQLILADTADHALEEKYVASACRDYSEALRALEQARLNSMKGEQHEQSYRRDG